MIIMMKSNTRVASQRSSRAPFFARSPSVRSLARSFVRQRVLFEPRRRSPESSGRRRLMSTFLLLPTADRRGAASARKCKLAAREFDSALFVGGRSSGRQTRGRRQRGHLF